MLKVAIASQTGDDLVAAMEYDDL